MPQIWIFLRPEDYSRYASLSKRMQKKLRIILQDTALKEMKLIPEGEYDFRKAIKRKE